MPQQQQPQSHMATQAYANNAMGTLQVSFSFKVEPPTDSLCHMLVSVMVFDFCFQVSMWLQLLGFITPQPFGVYPWHAYVPHGDGLWSMPGMPLMAALSSMEYQATHTYVPQSFHQYGGAYSLAECHLILPPYPHGGGRSFPGSTLPGGTSTLNL